MTNELVAALHACRTILTKLQQITDAPTQQLRQGPAPPKYADSRVPVGVQLNGTMTKDAAPSKEFSLWAHYSWRMKRAQKAEDAPLLIKLAACATRDYEIHTGRRHLSIHEDHETAVIELLRDHTGVKAAEAAWFLDVPERWVRRQRVINGRDAELGEPGVKESERTKKIVAMAESGMKQRVIAEEIGITQQRVQQILAGR